MLTLAEFMEGLDAQQGETPTRLGQIRDAAMHATAAMMLPTFELWAERAGVDLEELTVEIRERVPGATGIVLRRIGQLPDAAGLTDVEGELNALACAVALQFFCAGVLWEQQRQLPDLDIGAPA